MAEPKHTLPIRQVGSNMDPWTLYVTDDRPVADGGSGGAMDWTKNPAGSADQHTATFKLSTTATPPVEVFSGACATLTANGKVSFTASLAQANLLAAGKYLCQWTVLNAAGTVAHRSEVYGQTILANLP